MESKATSLTFVPTTNKAVVDTDQQQHVHLDNTCPAS